MKPSLIVHGGAWDIPDEAVNACNEGCRRALAAGWNILTSGGPALDAIQAAVMVLEDDPVFDAGYGSHLNLDGNVECDAIVMEGATLRAGAAAGLQRIKNPIRLARKILESSPHMMLIGEGAERFAKDSGLALCKPEELVSEAEWQAYLLKKRISTLRSIIVDTIRAPLALWRSTRKAAWWLLLPRVEPAANFRAALVTLP